MNKQEYLVSLDGFLAMQNIPTDIPFLGDFEVVSGLLIEFSQKVMGEYDLFLRGQKTGYEAQTRIVKICRAYADIFAGRRPKEYTFPPWLDERFSLMRSIYELGFKPKTDACAMWLEFLANMSINALKDMVLYGKTEAETAPKLGEILSDAALIYLKIQGKEAENHESLVPKIPR